MIRLNQNKLWRVHKMDLVNKYDETNPVSIEEYSKNLIGKTFEEVLQDFFKDNHNHFLKAREQFNNPYSKGTLTDLIREFFFGYLSEESSEYDFSESGVNLKVLPYDRLNNGEIRSGERLMLNLIPNDKPVPNSFEESVVYKELESILLVLYLRKEGLPQIEFPINYSQLISFRSEIFENDLEIIKSDYQIIINKIKSGKFYELTEADTMYLGAVTRGRTAKESYQSQYYNPHKKAKRRAFSLKKSYMNSFINKYIVDGSITHDEIAEEPVSKEIFEDIVIEKLEAYKGISEKELRHHFDLIDSKSKDIYSQLALKILNINTETAEEFKKSNTRLKSIRIEENGNVRENMSFPVISFKEFAEEEWEESSLYEYFSATRFLFVTYRKRDGEFYLDDALFWHMPTVDLEGAGQQDWRNTQSIIRKGVEFTISGTRILNNIPKKTQTEIFHLRPKAQKAAYSLPDIQFEIGNVDRDADVLPNGDMMTKQCFWLNNDYVKLQIEENK